MGWLVTWEAFVKTVELGSMAAAARRLDCSRAQVSKQLAELEAAFGVRLVERTTRKLHVTPAGEVFYQQALRVLAQLKETELAVQHVVDTPTGILRITASIAFGRLHIAPLLPRFAVDYPQVQCELVLTDRALDLVDEKFDLALRLTDAPPDNAVARKLAVIERRICASPAYLARRGVPRSPDDLAHHDCFAYLGARTESDWTLRSPSGALATVPVRGKFQISHLDGILDAVLGGHGLAILPTYVCGPHLARGELVAVLADHEPVTSFGRHVYATYPVSRVHLPKLRVFLDALERAFTPAAPWERA